VINDRTVDAVVNTISPSTAIIRDGFYIRRTAVERGIPCYTSIDTARAAAESVLHGSSVYNVLPMDEYLRGGKGEETSSQP